MVPCVRWGWVGSGRGCAAGQVRVPPPNLFTLYHNKDQCYIPQLALSVFFPMSDLVQMHLRWGVVVKWKIKVICAVACKMQ